MGISNEPLPPPHHTISGYDGGSRQRISNQITPALSVPGTRFHDPSIEISVVELPNRPYKAIIGWPYLQEKHIAIDGDGPLAHFPVTREDQLPAKPVSPARLRRLIKKLGPGSLGIAFVFDEIDPPTRLGSQRYPRRTSQPTKRYSSAQRQTLAHSCQRNITITLTSARPIERYRGLTGNSR